MVVICVILVAALCAAPAALAGESARAAHARQDVVCNILSILLPPVGLGMALYNSGEMKACYENVQAIRQGQKPQRNESWAGILHATFKLPAAAPEFMATYAAWRLTGANWREMDPLCVWAVDSRPYWMDVIVTAAKATVMTHAATHLPFLPRMWEYTSIPGHAFAWGGLAVGPGANLIAGTADQACRGASPFRQYYQQYQWWTGGKAKGAFL
jgi:hypothetical protein